MQGLSTFGSPLTLDPGPKDQGPNNLSTRRPGTGDPGHERPES